MEKENNSKKKNVVDLASFRLKKQVSNELANGRTPLYLSHLEGRVSNNPHLKGDHVGGEGFGDRISRIRKSLERINTLMNELKKLPEDEQRGAPSRRK